MVDNERRIFDPHPRNGEAERVAESFHSLVGPVALRVRFTWEEQMPLFRNAAGPSALLLGLAVCAAVEFRISPTSTRDVHRRRRKCATTLRVSWHVTERGSTLGTFSRS